MIAILQILGGIVLLGLVFTVLCIIFAVDIDVPPQRFDPFKWGPF